MYTIKKTKKNIRIKEKVYWNFKFSWNNSIWRQLLLRNGVLRNDRKKVKIKTNNSEHIFFIIALSQTMVSSSIHHSRCCSSVKRGRFLLVLILSFIHGDCSGPTQPWDHKEVQLVVLLRRPEGRHGPAKDDKEELAFPIGLGLGIGESISISHWLNC